MEEGGREVVDGVFQNSRELQVGESGRQVIQRLIEVEAT